MALSTLMVDTDVFSYITATNPRRGQPYKRHLDGQTIALSFVTAGELYAGYEKRIRKGDWPEARRLKLESLLSGVVIVPYDAEICRTYGRLRATLKNPDGTDRIIAPNDLWIAACAVRHSLALVTNNRKHFQNIPGLTLISEAPL
jgi:tRNA(fMet)-specific endonuclease VapC